MGIQHFQTEPQKLRKRIQIIITNQLTSYMTINSVYPDHLEEKLLINNQNDTISPDNVEEEEDEEDEEEDERMVACLCSSSV